MSVISKLAMYGSAPFFCMPYKPFMNQSLGAPYERAYRHFRRDHDKMNNLVYHCMCLVLQLTYNFGLLNEMDEALTSSGSPILSMSTAALWSATLMVHTTAPRSVKALSVISIAIAYKLRKTFKKYLSQMCALQAFVQTRAFQMYALGERGEPTPFDARQYATLLAARLTLQKLMVEPASGVLNKARKPINLGLAAFMLSTCREPFQGTMPFVFGMFGDLLSFLTQQPWMFFYSGGFMATLCQGVAHDVAKQPGTLPQLSEFRDEIAHSTYFPTLLLHSVHQSLTGVVPAGLDAA
ncbi:Hypothetical Protein FCC1311_009042 [Hondaea fermentalgiana]|uniref:Uncharacterized protein n=1 Tax=Hondaea fermentalgiana TaxID=2315210 RepID=A0A2R5G0Z2_9STRA|nr:Hypothetical Protein FCC1311_009042 [Hondaea fermentalgiana]|eukprot:GBG24686.1 Hypothetical Protein FCC1311_009042 [Hondaea fermentalgiana]